jgi:hypothetical protein
MDARNLMDGYPTGYSIPDKLFVNLNFMTPIKGIFAVFAASLYAREKTLVNLRFCGY